MKLRFNGRQVIKHFKSNLIESYTNHIIPTKLVVEIPYDGYTLTLLPSSDCIVGNGLVNWGDGTVSDLNKSLIHKYSKAGTYIIEGSFILKATATDSLKETLIMIEYLSNKHTNLASCFIGFTKLRSINQKRCHLNVTNMEGTYRNCYNLIKKPICEPNVNNMSFTYQNCYNLTGSPVCGPNVTGMYFTYFNCYNLTGSPVCGPNVIDMTYTYADCKNLTGSPVCGDLVSSINHAYFNCYNLTGIPVCGPNVRNMVSAYQNCYNLTGNPVCGNNVINMSSAYDNCYNITGSPVCGNNVVNMGGTYYNCHNLTGQPVCGPNVVNMGGTYYNCHNLTGSPVCGDNVTNFVFAYDRCHNLTGSPVCGDKVIVMSFAYNGCNKITGHPVCGPNVTSFAYAYYGCTNLSGSPVCGPNVTSMSSAYAYCYNLTGSPVCGDNVKDMSSAYSNCHNLTGPAIVGKNVTNIAFAYAYSANISRNAYIFSEVINNHVYAINACFGGKNDNKRLDIYVPKTNNIRGILSNSSGTTSLLGKQTTWITTTSNPGTTYNARFNTYIHEVDDVQRVYDENERLVVTYDSTNAELLPTVSGGGYRTYQNIVNGIYHTNLCRADNVITYVGFSRQDTLTKIDYMSNNITSLYGSFTECRNLTGDPWCGPNVTDMDSTYFNCRKLTGNPVCGDNVRSMCMTYSECHNLTGSPVCGNNVRNMRQAYHSCGNLTGNPLCGNLVTDFNGTYWNCSNLTGEPVCGPNVTSMQSSYENCPKLTGSPVCGDKVTDMAYSYQNCINLTGPAIAGPNVTNLMCSYKNCYNIGANAYFFGNNVYTVTGCFNNKNNARMLNLYVHLNSNTLNTCVSNSTYSLVQNNITWTNDMTANGCYFNTGYNIYIYPVNDVYNTYYEIEMNKPFIKYIIFDINYANSVYLNTTNRYDYNNIVTNYSTVVEPFSNERYGNDCYEVSVFTDNKNITEFCFGNSARVYEVTYLNPNITTLWNSFTYMTYYKYPIATNVLNNVVNMKNAYLGCGDMTGPAAVGSNVIDMAYCYNGCYTLTGSPVCGPNVVDMTQAYYGCSNLTGSPVCGPNVTSMRYTYNGCSNLTGNPVCGPNVVDMSWCYNGCFNLTGSPVCGPNVTNMAYCYNDCSNLTGEPVCGDLVTDMDATYSYGYNLTGKPVCGPNVTDMYYTYRGCTNLTGPAVAGPNVTSMYRTYYNCVNIAPNAYMISPNIVNARGSFTYKLNDKQLNIFVPENSTTLNTFLINNNYSIVQNNITWTDDMVNNNCYYNTAYNIYIYPVNDVADRYNKFLNLIVMYTASSDFAPNIDNGYTDYTKESNRLTNGDYFIEIYRNNSSYNATHVNFREKLIGKLHYLTDSINSLYSSFQNCKILTGDIICKRNVTNMCSTYGNCHTLLGSPVCGPNVTDMSWCYDCCYNLTGNPVCGDKVTNMSKTYQCCYNLTGDPVCGPNVTDMAGTYHNCNKLTGRPVCGNNVVRMQGVYHNCTNLTGPAIAGPNVNIVDEAYKNCQNIEQHAYFFSNTINSVYGCFNNKNNAKRLNLYVPGNSITLNTCLRNDEGSLVGSNITWTDDMTTNGCYFNTGYNIYIYPVNNVDDYYYNHYVITEFSSSGSILYPRIYDANGEYTNYSVSYTRYSNGNYDTIMFKNNINDVIDVVNFSNGSIDMSLIRVNYITPTVTDMYKVFYNCRSIVSSVNCGPNVTNMVGAYSWCSRLTGQPTCGPNVTDMSDAYQMCQQMRGVPVCGPNVTNMYSAFNHCRRLTGDPVCGPNVTDMDSTYYCCSNLTGPPVYGPNVTNFSHTYMECERITGNPVCPDPAESMRYTYHNCYSLTGQPVCGPNVSYMECAYYNCKNLKDPAVIGPKVTATWQTYGGCDQFTNAYVYSNTVRNVAGCFSRTQFKTNKLNVFVRVNSTSCNEMVTMNDYRSLVGTNITWVNDYATNRQYYNGSYNIFVYPVNDVTETRLLREKGIISYATSDNSVRPNIIGVNGGYTEIINGEIITIIKNNPNDIVSYVGFTNANDAAKIKEMIYITPDASNIHNTFNGAYNMTGRPVCGPNVTNMCNVYNDCRNLVSIPRCGDNVVDMSNAYRNCQNLTGSPVCGDKVVNMAYAYSDCYNLTGFPICGNNVSNLSYAYSNCTQIDGNAFIFSSIVNNVTGAFSNKNNAKRLNVFVPENSNTLNTFLINNANSLVGNNITWTNDMTGNGCYFNTGYNIYIYPVNDVYNTKLNKTSMLTLLTSDPTIVPVIDNSTYIGYDREIAMVNDNLYKVDICKCNMGYEIQQLSCYNIRSLIDIDIKNVNSITNMNAAFTWCSSLTGSPVCGDKITNMYYMYYYCSNLTGNPVCGPNVVNMYNAYGQCYNLTGNPICGDNVRDMCMAYWNCHNLTGSPVCGPNVVEMKSTYANCFNLTGSPVCGPNVVNMYYAYENCYNLTGTAIVGPNVRNTYRAFDNCKNITSAIISEGATNISFSTFSGCEMLGHVKVAQTVNYIDSYAFSNTPNLAVIDFSNHAEIPYVSSSTFYQSNPNCLIMVPESLYSSWCADSAWSNYANMIIPYTTDKAVVKSNVKERYKVEFGGRISIQLQTLNFDDNLDNITVNIESDNSGLITEPTVNFEATSISGKMKIDINACEIEGTGNVTLTVRSGSFVYTESFVVEVVEEIPVGYTVESVEGAEFGFSLRSDGFYESDNIGQDDTAALCKVVITNSDLDVCIDCINFAESSYDFGILSNVDCTLSTSSEEDTVNVFHLFKGESSPDIQTVNYGPISGTIYIKFRKDGSYGEENDSLRFRVRFE